MEIKVLMERKLKNWLAELRTPFLTATLVSVILGTAIAWTRDGIAHAHCKLLSKDQERP